MKKTCQCCEKPFVLANDDLEFYRKVEVPEPDWCPKCREMRRMAWCNEGVLYANICNLCGEKSVSQFSSKNPRQAYCFNCWWSDKWNAEDYAQEVDLNRSFFSQFKELVLASPHCHTHTDLANENSAYTHHAGHEKNCYMMFHCSYAEDCYYGYGVKKAKDCVDNHYCHESELCYECIDVHNCYDLAWSQDCSNCSSSKFIFDCIGCKNCFLSTGLRNKEYYFLNQKLSRAEYEEKVSKINFGSWSEIKALSKEMERLKGEHVYQNLYMTMVENCLGDHLYKARESQFCFDCSDIEFSKYCSQLQLGTRYCHDIYQFGIQIELCYECAMVGYNIYNCQFCYDLLQQCSNLQYCISCHSTQDSFGCFGLKKKQYCILNKQYSKDDYFALKEKIIEKMKSDGEYGSFLPLELSPHGYNETLANVWYPKSKEEVLAKGWYWEDGLPFSRGRATLHKLDDDIESVQDGITKEILCCETCARDYKIVAQELSYYRKNQLPLPRECFQCRRERRMNARNSRKFSLRQCDKCSVDMPSTIPESSNSTVYCEKCYLEHAY